MTKPGILLVVGICLITCSAPDREQEQAIRVVRESSNRALEAHDTTALAFTLTDDYNVVTSRNAASSERGLMLSRLEADWASKPDLIYRRTPSSIEVFSNWQMAAESGTWRGTWTEPNGEKIMLAGSYYAKWHRLDGQWRIRAEIFTPTQCTGGEYCQKGPLERR